jgi:hypothetical protein
MAPPNRDVTSEFSNKSLPGIGKDITGFPPLALLGHANWLGNCPLIGGGLNRKSSADGQNDANDPLLTLQAAN